MCLKRRRPQPSSGKTGGYVASGFSSEIFKHGIIFVIPALKTPAFLFRSSIYLSPKRGIPFQENIGQKAIFVRMTLKENENIAPNETEWDKASRARGRIVISRLAVRFR
jgi:hypothetical protein